MFSAILSLQQGFEVSWVMLRQQRVVKARVKSEMCENFSFVGKLISVLFGTLNASHAAHRCFSVLCYRRVSSSLSDSAKLVLLFP